MNPYKAIQTPPITQDGIVDKKVEKGATKANTSAITAVTKIVLIEAFPLIATVPTDSP